MATKNEKTNPKPVDNVRISGITGTIATVVFVLGIGGLILMDMAGVSDGWIALEITLTILIAMYFLFAVKVAAQWEKAVVLRLGKFRALGRARG